MTNDADDKSHRHSHVEWEHWCMHNGCKKWGAFGFTGHYGTEWFCRDHRDEGEEVLKK